MNRILTLFVCLFTAVSAYAGNEWLTTSKPQNPWYTVNQGAISDVSIEVTPKGANAQVDMIFRIGVDSMLNYTATDTFESIFYFDLPSNSFIHDSWLWLNDTTIISADVVERDRAIQVYTGIVNRRRDPSLLINILNNTYRFNVFPITKNYRRKVKISYTTPIVWQNGKANIDLPVRMLAAAKYPPAFTLKVNTDNTYSQPSFVAQNFAGMVTAQAAGSYTLNVPASVYYKIINGSGQPAMGLTLSYVFQGNGLLATYPVSANQGYYQVVLPPVAAATTPKHIVFLFDQNDAYGQYYNIHTSSEQKELLKTWMINELSSADSFSIFYLTQQNTVAQSFNGWHAADTAGINTAINNIPGNPNSYTPPYEQLLKSGFAFAQTRPDAQSVLLSNNYTYSNYNSIAADTLYAHVTAYLGSYTNKISVINTSRYQVYTGTTNIPAGNEYLYNKFCSASGGAHYKMSQMLYDSYGSRYLAALDIQALLHRILWTAGYNTAGYNITLPVTGFTANTYDVNGYDRYSPGGMYAETGKYFGSISPGDITVQYVDAASQVNSNTYNITQLQNLGNNLAKCWNYRYMRQLLLNGSVNRQEILDSSIHNRVLIDYTAFLAVETGDTLKTNVDNANVGIEPVAGSPKEVKVYPNPFSDRFYVESDEDITQVQVYDMMGRLVLAENYAPGTRRAELRFANRDLPPGIYLVRISNGEHTAALRLQKQ